MTIRKRNDSVKPGKGIDSTEGENYSREYAKDPWGYGGSSTKGGSEGNGHEPADERSEPGAYTDNDSGLRNVEDFQFTARGGSTQRGAPQWGDDIFDDVMANDRPRGDDNFGFDATGPVKFGVNKKQGK